MLDHEAAGSRSATRAWCLVAALAVAACVAQPSTAPVEPGPVIAAPPPKPPARRTRHPAVAAPVPVPRPAGAEADHILAQAAARVQAPLEAYRQEPPGSCDSRNLMIAGLWAGGFADSFARSATTAQRRFYGGLALDVADAARERGCPIPARDLYGRVLGTYADGDYAELRQRAERGLAALPP